MHKIPYKYAKIQIIMNIYPFSKKFFHFVAHLA